MGRYSDPESRGTGFDSRLAQIIFGSLFGIFWNVLESALGHCGDLFGLVSEGFDEQFGKSRDFENYGHGLSWCGKCSHTPGEYF